MQTCAERGQSPASTQTKAGTITALAVLARPTAGERQALRVADAMSVRRRVAVHSGHTMTWPDLVQSFAHDAAEMPIISRLLAGQVVLALGYASLRGALALRERTHARRHLLLGGLTAAAGIAFARGALAAISRTRAAPAVTAFFAYGHALRQYFPPRRPLAPAA